MANMTLVQAKAALDAANQKLSAYQLEARDIELKIKQARVDIDDAQTNKADAEKELTKLKEELDSAKKTLDKVNSDPDSTDEDKAAALASYNKILARVADGEAAVSEADALIAAATAILKSLENDDIFDLIIESQKAAEDAEARYDKEIEIRNSDSLAGDESSAYSLDPLKRYQNCNKQQNLLQKNVQVAALGKSKNEYGVGALQNYERAPYLNAEVYTGHEILNAFFNDNIVWDGNLNAGEDMVMDLRAKSDIKFKEDGEVYVGNIDSKGRAIFQNNVDEYGKAYEGLFAASKVEPVIGRAIDTKSAEFAMKEVEFVGSSNYIIPHYEAGTTGGGVANPDAWGTVSTPIRARRDELAKAYREMKVNTHAYELITRLEVKGEFDRLVSIVVKGNDDIKDEVAAKAVLVDYDIYELDSEDWSSIKKASKDAMDKANDEWKSASATRDADLQMYQKAQSSNAWLTSGKNINGWLRYVKADADFSAITTTYEWIIVMESGDTEPYLGIKGSNEAFDQFKAVLAGGKFAAVEANGETVLSKGTEHWEECRKFIADYEEKQEVTDTYSDVIETALANFSTEAQEERATLAKALTEIPNANIAKALSQVKNIKFEDVAIAIKKAILKGAYSCLIEGFVEASVLKHLLDQGYQVSEVLDDIDHSTGKVEAKRDGATILTTKDVATKIAWDGAIADYKSAKDQEWYKFEWDSVKLPE